MGRIVFLLILGAIGWYCWKTGIAYGIMHALKPEVGREAEICAPFEKPVYYSLTMDDMKFPIDAHIGNPGQRAEAVSSLKWAMGQGRIYQIDAHTKVKILDNGVVSVVSVPFHVVKVRLTSGEAKGSEGWVERGDLIDTPVQEVALSFSKMSPKDGESTGSGNSGGDKPQRGLFAGPATAE